MSESVVALPFRNTWWSGISLGGASLGHAVMLVSRRRESLEASLSDG